MENLGAADIALSADDLAGIDAAAAGVAVHGHRYQERLQRMVDR